MKRIFLSYAHADHELKRDLVEHFDTIDESHALRLWHDDLLRAGEEFDPAIEAALRSSRFCILLLSRKFLVSNYIMTREYPLIQQLERNGQLTVFAIRVGFFPASANKSITRRSQACYDAPLNLLTLAKRDRKLSDFVDHVVQQCRQNTRGDSRPPIPKGRTEMSELAPPKSKPTVDMVAIDSTTARTLLRAGIDDDWFNKFNAIPHPSISTYTANGVRYFLSSGRTELPERVILFDLSSEAALFADSTISSTLFRRGLQVALARWLDSISVPRSWKPYYDPQLNAFTVYPASIKLSRYARLHVKFIDDIPKVAFVHHLAARTISVLDAPLRMEAVQRAMDGLIDATVQSKPNARASKDPRGVISLDLPIGGAFSAQLSYDEWYKKLTTKQARFVDAPINGPIRLRGPAGTGKTLALVMKMMREARIHSSNKEEWRALFLTHSQSTVNYVWSLLDSIDRDTMISIDEDNPVTLRFHTIYDLASERTLPSDSDVEPLSTDGKEGRETQKQLLAEVIDDLVQDEGKFRAWTHNVSTPLKSSIERAAGAPEADVIFELLNEFASKITGEGLDHRSDEDQQYYLDEPRVHRWLMPLETRADRRAVWLLYRAYCELLADKGLLSLDHIVADLNSDLQKNEYRMRRAREGFDVIFVDEAHLFSQIERDTLPRLLRRPPEQYANGPPIILAHDLKQSPDNRFAQLYDREHSRRWVAASAQNAQTHEFDEVHRFTPQISALVEAIDKRFPQFMIADDWAHYTGKSLKSDGPKPEFGVFDTLEHLASAIAEAAAKAAAGHRSSRVAVLCVDEKRFERLATFMLEEAPSAITIIDERGDQSLMQTARNRFIFSRPDYVAGLQFDTVFVVGADRDVEQRGDIGGQRVYLSNLYTAVTRAERSVFMAICMESGGVPSVIESALEGGAIEEAGV